MRSSDHLKGVILVTVSAVLWSTAGLFVRAIRLDIWTLMAWRSVFAFASMALLAVVIGDHGRSWSSRLGRPSLVYAPVAAISMLCFIYSLRLTSVANVMIVYATVPFIAAGVSYVVLRERARRDVLIASAFALVGVCITAGSALSMSDLVGNLLSLLMTLCFAATLVLARRWPQLDLTAATALASALCGGVCCLFASHAVPSIAQLWWILLFSLATQSIGYLFFVLGARYISASEAGFLGLLDVLLAPVWVWLAFGERPRVAAVIGGVIILCAVIWYISRERPERQADVLLETGDAS